DTIPSFGLAAEDTITVLGVRPLPTTRFVNPIISNDLSKSSGSNRKEAWVHIKLHLTPAGDVTHAELVEAFPRDYYENAVLKVAHGWKFPPSNETEMDVGVAIYTNLYESQRNPSLRSGHVRGVSLYNFTSLQNVYNDI